MRPSPLHIFSFKLSAFLMALMPLSCAIELEEGSGESSSAPGNEHELIAVFEEAYAARITSDDFVCERHGKDGEVLYVALDVKEGPEAGLRLAFQLVGLPEEGAALTPDNSSHERFFEITMTNPQGVIYRYHSFADRDLGPRGAMTVVRSSEFVRGVRLWVDDVLGDRSRQFSAPAVEASEKPLLAHMSLQCSRWN